MSGIEMFLAFGLFTFIAETYFPDDSITFIDGTKECVTHYEGECITHEQLQRPDGLLDLDKAKAVGLI